MRWMSVDAIIILFLCLAVRVSDVGGGGVALHHCLYVYLHLYSHKYFCFFYPYKMYHSVGFYLYFIYFMAKMLFCFVCTLWPLPIFPLPSCGTVTWWDDVKTFCVSHCDIFTYTHGFEFYIWPILYVGFTVRYVI